MIVEGEARGSTWFLPSTLTFSPRLTSSAYPKMGIVAGTSAYCFEEVYSLFFGILGSHYERENGTSRRRTKDDNGKTKRNCALVALLWSESQHISDHVLHSQHDVAMATCENNARTMKEREALLEEARRRQRQDKTKLRTSCLIVERESTPIRSRATSQARRCHGHV